MSRVSQAVRVPDRESGDPTSRYSSRYHVLGSRLRILSEPDPSGCGNCQAKYPTVLGKIVFASLDETDVCGIDSGCSGFGQAKLHQGLVLHRRVLSQIKTPDRSRNDRLEFN